ncbi:MAG: AbrB/MazE/SpoVT family DNA-binding domain-containing protein [Pseudolysinimonas sp.]|uniref:AbrB/MazE/SpoVT family DNA-binding domain-containing protein n=1 Tax=Pseudolysinimonas sp. TaxID=2680009 RepID=UPI003266928A
MRITSKGQVTIPQYIRERHGFLPDTEIDFVEQDGLVVVRPSRAGSKPDRAERLVSGLRGSGRGELSTDEIMRLTRDYE